MTTIASGFSAAKPISCAMGRYGELIIAQGGGVQPKRWTGAGTATNAGIPAPTTAPAVSINTTKRYYVARVDVQRAGIVYNAPPVVTFVASGAQPANHRPAKATAYLSQAALSEIVVTDGGKYYTAPPSVSLSNSHGTGATFVAELAANLFAGGLYVYEITQEPPFSSNSRLTQYDTWGPVEIPIANGSGSISRTFYVWHGGVSDDPDDCNNYVQLSTTLSYTISGVNSGASGAKARINFSGEGIDYAECSDGPSGITCAIGYHTSTSVDSVEAVTPGSGYTTPVTITISAALGPDPTGASCSLSAPTGSGSNIVITATPGADGAYGRAVTGVTVTNAGSGYVVAPQLEFSSDSGFGASATCTVSGGAITAVVMESGGGSYLSPPAVKAITGGAEAFAVARPHMRGKYQCYYRYTDDTDADHGGPIPSNLSPVLEADAGDGASVFTWTVAAPGAGSRATKVELWRSTGDQAVLLYRVATITSFASGSATFVDDLTDDELRDPDRQGYSAMPVVLPNGDLNAMRFTPPPGDKAVVVRYQDRFWYGVDTSGSEPNSIYFSEVDEPESVPDINEFVLQQNVRDGDFVTALIPFGTSMLVMQSRHAYSLSFAKQPLRDADVTPIGYRGCAGQRCWDIHGGVCYIMDQFGVYAVTAQGEIKDISAPIEDIFRNRIDNANASWNFVLVDAVKKVMRAFVAFKEDASGGYPTRALCYSIDSNTWWMERYPQRISAGAMAAGTNGDYRPIYGGRGGAYLLDEGACDLARGSIVTVTVTNKGAGYRTPPTVTATGGSGGELQAVINAQGQVSGIWIVNPGYGYTSGSLTISAPDDPNCASPVQATATFTATTNASDTALYPVYRYKSGNYAFPTDATDRGGGQQQPRDISLTYKPQQSTCSLALRLYYNNARHARNNVASRNRGAGFAISSVDGAARLDMSALTTKTGYDSGVAKASFASRTIDDMRSGDRHVAVEMIGAPSGGEPVAVYALDVYGTSAGGS